MKSHPLIIAISLFFLAQCGQTSQSAPEKKFIEGRITMPRIDFEKDTLETGDSLRARIFIEFDPALTLEQTKSYLNTVEVYFDPSIAARGGELKDYRYNATPIQDKYSYLVAFMPDYENVAKDTVKRMEFMIGLRLLYRKDTNKIQPDTSFVNAQSYYIKN